VELKVYVYQGTETTDKGNPVYTLSNDVINGTDYVVFEISEFVRDNFNFEFDGSNYISNTQWLTVEATLYNDTTVLSTETANYLAFDGYTEYTDGLNAQGSRDLMQTTKTIIIPEGETVKVPVYSEDVVSVITYRYSEGFAISQGRWDLETQTWDVNEDYWDDSSTATVNVVTDTAALSAGKIAYFTIDDTIGRVDVQTAGTTTTLLVKPTNGYCKHGYRKLTFINKHGAYQDLFFMGASKDTVSFTGSEYKAAKINFDTMSYSQTSGQYKRYDVNSNVTKRLSTGWVYEDMNSAIEEMLMSEAMWLTEDGVTVPVLPVTNSLEKIKHVDKNLINYDIDFKLAYDNNNSVI
jgi:hypothetical protein